MIKSIDFRTGQVTIDNQAAPSFLPDAATALARKRSNLRASRYQLRAALVDVGKLNEAKTAMQAAPNRVALAWAEADTIKRSGQLANALGIALGYTDLELDALFEAAAEIEA